MSDKTILDSNTEREIAKTVLDQENPSSSSTLSLQTFRGSNIVKEFEAIGAEADGYLVEKGNKQYFLKLYRKGIKLNEDILKTIKELSQNHKFFAELFEYGFDESIGRHYELSEYIQYGSLNAKLIDSSNIDILISSLNEALSLLHKNKIIHRDLKPNNILLRNKNPLAIVLVDFGISSVIKDDMSHVVTSLKGTYAYTAPEALSEYFGKEVDYWALGMIVLEMLDKNPFSGLSYTAIKHELITSNIDIPQQLDERVRNLLKGLLTRDPMKRWGYIEVSKWLKGKQPNIYFYDEDESIEKKYKYKESYYTKKELARAFVKRENFEDALKHIARGYIAKYLEKIEEFDEAIKLDEFETPIEKLVYFIYSQEKELPFSLYGIVIDKEYIINILIKNQALDATEDEQKIIELLKNNTLKKLCHIYTDQTNKELSLSSMLQQFPRNQADLMQYIDINDAIEKNDTERVLLLSGNIKSFDTKTLSLSIKTNNPTIISQVLYKTINIDRKNIYRLISLGYGYLLKTRELSFASDITPNILLSILLIHGDIKTIKKLFSKEEIIDTTYSLLFDDSIIASIDLPIYHKDIFKAYLSLGYSLNEFTINENMKNKLIDSIIKKDNLNIFRFFEYLLDKETVYRKITNPSRLNLKMGNPLFYLEGSIVKYITEKDTNLKKDLEFKKEQIIIKIKKEEDNAARTKAKIKQKQSFIKFKTRLKNTFSFYFIFLFVLCVLKKFFTLGEGKCQKMFDYLDGKEVRLLSDRGDMDLLTYIILKPIDLLLGFIFDIFNTKK